MITNKDINNLTKTIELLSSNNMNYLKQLKRLVKQYNKVCERYRNCTNLLFRIECHIDDHDELVKLMNIYSQRSDLYYMQDKKEEKEYEDKED